MKSKLSLGIILARQINHKLFYIAIDWPVELCLHVRSNTALSRWYPVRKHSDLLSSLPMSFTQFSKLRDIVGRSGSRMSVGGDMESRCTQVVSAAAKKSNIYGCATNPRSEPCSDDDDDRLW